MGSSLIVSMILARLTPPRAPVKTNKMRRWKAVSGLVLAVLRCRDSIAVPLRVSVIVSTSLDAFVESRTAGEGIRSGIQL